MHIQNHIKTLGFQVKDRVTGFKGVIESISFDLYGCVQAVVRPPIDKNGGLPDSRWFDVTRLEFISRKPVMKGPNFDFGPQAEGQQGPADKPTLY